MNEVPDCDETLVLNATFDENTEHWSPEEGVQIDWNSTDAQTVQSSGSLVVTNEFVADTNEYVTRAATQCIPVEGFKVYALFAEALIEAEEVRGFALLGAWFYDGPDCVGAASLAITPRTGTLRRWTTLGQRFTSQATAKSLLVRLGVAKPYSQSEPVTVRFDNVLVRRE